MEIYHLPVTLPSVFLLRIWCTESTDPTLNTWRIVSLLKVSTIYQAQAFSQGCQAWGFKKGTQAEGEQEMQGNKARLEFKRCTFNSNRKKDRRTLGSSSNSLREGQHSLNTKENITRPLQQIQPPDNKEVSILSQLMISQADGNRSIIAASRVPEIWAVQVGKGKALWGRRGASAGSGDDMKAVLSRVCQNISQGNKQHAVHCSGGTGLPFIQKTPSTIQCLFCMKKLFWSTD